MLTNLTPTAAELLTTWQNTLPGLAEAKAAVAAERAARDALVAHVFKDDAPGTHNFVLPKGWTLKYVRSIEYKMDKTPADPNVPTGPTKTDAMLDKLEALGNDGAFIAERIVKFTPELSVTEYKKLTPEQKAIVDGVVTSKDSAPELKLVPPADTGK